MGEVYDFDGDKPIIQSWNTRLFISDKSKDELIEKNTNSLVIAIAMVGLLIAGILILVFE